MLTPLLALSSGECKRPPEVAAPGQADGSTATSDGGIVGFFSLEMSAEQLATRIIAEHLLQRYGFAELCTSVRCIDLPVLAVAHATTPRERRLPKHGPDVLFPWRVHRSEFHDPAARVWVSREHAKRAPQRLLLVAIPRGPGVRVGIGVSEERHDGRTRLV